VFVTSQGSPHARFERALHTGNPTLVRAAAAELPRVGLDDALRICVVLAVAEPEVYERAAVRWLGRLLLDEPGVTLAQAQLAATALGVLPRCVPDAPAIAALGKLCEERGLLGAARTLAELAERLDR